MRNASSRASVETLADFFRFIGFDNRFFFATFCAHFKLWPFVQQFLTRLPLEFQRFRVLLLKLPVTALEQKQAAVDFVGC